MKLVTVHVKPPIPSRELDWSAYDADADLCYEPTCGCRMRFAQGTGATEEAAIVSFVQDLLEKRGADLYEVWPGAASEKKNCNVRLANPSRLKEGSCGNAGSTKES